MHESGPKPTFHHHPNTSQNYVMEAMLAQVQWGAEQIVNKFSWKFNEAHLNAQSERRTFLQHTRHAITLMQSSTDAKS